MPVSVRYIVDDVDAAIPFYTDMLDFKVDMHFGQAFASLSRGDLRLLLNKPGGAGGAGQSMPDGRAPAPGGWLRFQIEVPDIEATVARPEGCGSDAPKRRSLRVAAASRSWSTTHPAIRWSCSSPA